jgi:hypothetical protein
VNEPVGASMADLARTHPHSVLSAAACNHSPQKFALRRSQ